MLAAELELERQLREWEREQQPQLPSQTVIADSRGDEASHRRVTNTPSFSQARTQPMMAKDYDVLKRDGDSQETSASPPRANISVFPPVMAQTLTTILKPSPLTRLTPACVSLQTI